MIAASRSSAGSPEFGSHFDDMSTTPSSSSTSVPSAPADSAPARPAAPAAPAPAAPAPASASAPWPSPSATGPATAASARSSNPAAPCACTWRLAPPGCGVRVVVTTPDGGSTPGRLIAVMLAPGATTAAARPMSASTLGTTCACTCQAWRPSGSATCAPGIAPSLDPPPMVTFGHSRLRSKRVPGTGAYPRSAGMAAAGAAEAGPKIMSTTAPMSMGWPWT